MRPSRELRRRLSRDLAGAGAIHSEELADAFAARGFQSIPDEYLRLFGGGGERVAEIFLHLHDIQQLIAVTTTATEKAARIVPSLRTYTHVQTMESVGPVDLARQLDAVILSMSPPLEAGIPEEKRGQVFDPFFRTKGSGLGAGPDLLIAKAIVEPCEGSIGFESSPKGTVSRVMLPAWEG